MLHPLSRIHEHGRGKKDVHRRIDDAARKACRTGRKGRIEITLVAFPDKENEKEQCGHEHRVENGNPLHAFFETQKDEQKPQNRRQRIELGKKGIEPCEHSCTGHEGAKDDYDLRNRRRLFEQRL